jgi:hypothetical protein
VQPLLSAQIINGKANAAMINRFLGLSFIASIARPEEI